MCQTAGAEIRQEACNAQPGISQFGQSGEVQRLQMFVLQVELGLQGPIGNALFLLEPVDGLRQNLLERHGLPSVWLIAPLWDEPLIRVKIILQSAHRLRRGSGLR
jgi:hypothetical protein